MKRCFIKDCPHNAPYGSGGDMTAFQIAEVTNLSENTVTTHLRKLVVAGLAVVMGEYMSSDRKGGPAPRLFALTPEGMMTE